MQMNNSNMSKYLQIYIPQLVQDIVIENETDDEMNERENNDNSDDDYILAKLTCKMNTFYFLNVIIKLKLFIFQFDFRK